MKGMLQSLLVGLILLPLIAVKSALGQEPIGVKIAQHALIQVGVTKAYNSQYQKINYPLGDIALKEGTDTDVIIRAFRGIKLDLQALIHEDINGFFDYYPRASGKNMTDTNIDHRLIPNQRMFFARHGDILTTKTNPKAYLPGDIITWQVDETPIIGLVSNIKAANDDEYKVIYHNGTEVVLEESLFLFPIVGHYRWPGQMS